MINQIPSSYANAIAPFAPLGRQPVGQESADLRMSSFKPLEQLAPTAPGENRRSPDERPAEVDEQERLRQGRAARSPGEEPSDERDDARERQEESDQELIRELAARDREVRAHEQAHAAVGGQYASAPVYQYERGPDGVSYAVAGEVSINTSPIPGDPEATIQKAQQILRAANAPAEPSPQDRRVAAEAAQMEAEARIELRQQQQQENAARAQAAEESRREQEARDERESNQSLRAEQTAEQQRDERGRWLDESRNRSIDLNRRLIDIGVISSSSPAGSLLNQRV